MLTIDKIDRLEALRYLSYGDNEPDKLVSDIMDEYEKKLLEVITPKYLYRCFDIERTSDGIILSGSRLVLTGEDIAFHLDGCEKAVVLCATIGQGTDRLIRTTQIEDMARAVIADSMASVAVEQVCNAVDEIVKEEYKDYNQTWRFSAGYGDLPIELQKDFLDVLDAPRKIGLCTNNSRILTPKKSVTAVIGLSKETINQKKRGCTGCSMKDVCSFRKGGKHCGF